MKMIVPWRDTKAAMTQIMKNRCTFTTRVLTINGNPVTTVNVRATLIHLLVIERKEGIT